MNDRPPSDTDFTHWAPKWTKTSKRDDIPKTTHDAQERHSPTMSASLLKPGDSQRSHHRRRILDARLWGALSDNQQNAALMIDTSYHAISKGLGYRSSAPHLERIQSSARHEMNDHQASLIALYVDWAKHCTREGLMHAACVDILIFGKSCAAVDRDRKVRKGWAKQNLIDCLTEYCLLRGWPV